jgi:zinc finger SWIM domain-containing protein 3
MRYESREKLPRLKMKTFMWVQARKIYTPVIFECFQSEYERSTADCIVQDRNQGYMVKIGCLCEKPTFDEECKVICNPTEQTARCSCGQFERIGIF